mmetsp:Transcript_45689/g.110698  ORF Transcript_45689/g.110698 Transcript_45689/m.110698 type:complete len:137 (+) Transcript_45689:222-632(+)
MPLVVLSAEFTTVTEPMQQIRRCWSLSVNGDGDCSGYDNSSSWVPGMDLCHINNTIALFFKISDEFCISHYPFSLFFESQQKNTCAHNNTHKAHANGIKKAKRSKFVSTRGMDPKFLRNQKFAKKYNGSKRVHNDE